MRRNPIERLLRAGLCVSLTVQAGCGVLADRQTEFANQAETSDGRDLFVEDIEEIVNNDQLTSEEQAEALRELGIEDEDLVAALLTL